MNAKQTLTGLLLGVRLLESSREAIETTVPSRVESHAVHHLENDEKCLPFHCEIGNGGENLNQHTGDTENNADYFTIRSV